MRTLVCILSVFIIFSTKASAQSAGVKNFKELDAEWRREESSLQNEFRMRDRQWLKSDTENKGWRRDDSIWRQNDSKSDNEWRKRNDAWIKEDSR